MSDLFGSNRSEKTSYDKGMINPTAPKRKPKIPWDEVADNETSQSETESSQSSQQNSDPSQQDTD